MAPVKASARVGDTRIELDYLADSPFYHSLAEMQAGINQQHTGPVYRVTEIDPLGVANFMEADVLKVAYRWYRSAIRRARRLL